MTIDAGLYDFQGLNEKIRAEKGDVTIERCLGHRFIGAGESERTITLHGTPGNALGCYLNGATIVVEANAQDQVGDTMNDGKIIIHGDAGDAVGYAMRGGEIYVEGSAGYRAGIHMKAYKDKKPVVVIGSKAGSFLGEYQAGGIILVLGIGCADDEVYGRFCGTGMHGGKIFVRAKELCRVLPEQVHAEEADETALAEIKPYLEAYSQYFDKSLPDDGKKFFVFTPNSKNPYKKMYAMN
ncbi:MAG: glutamate synthase [Clostridiales bacterium]|nr:glutamate synthase [Clostridiales bacterium]